MNRALGTWGTIYTLVIIVLEGGKRGQEIIFEELWLKNFQIIVKDINLQFKKLRESQKDKLGGGECGDITRHIIVKLQTENNGKILKATREIYIHPRVTMKIVKK